MKTPAQLSAALVELVAKETGCEITWQNHPEPLTAHEAAAICGKALVLLIDEYQDAVERELASRARELERIHISNLGEDAQG